MPQVDWGNMALAFAAMAGIVGWAVMFGLNEISKKPSDGKTKH